MVEFVKLEWWRVREVGMVEVREVGVVEGS